MHFFRSWKALAFFVILSLFVLQSFFVYSDFGSGIERTPLSENALSGLKLWRSHNCQACHQIHGFGGFLGPDLTNVAERLKRAGFEQILTVGRKQMPAFGLSKENQDSLIAFFAELNATGRGFVTLSDSRSPERMLAVLHEHDVLNSSHRKMALSAVENLHHHGCLSCHKFFERSPAPDLTLALQHRNRDYAASNIRSGRGDMPAFPHLTGDEIENLLDGLEYLGLHREKLLSLYNEKRKGILFSLNRLPWYEY
jgi:nitric oxide reductase subunit C